MTSDRSGPGEPGEDCEREEREPDSASDPAGPSLFEAFPGPVARCAVDEGTARVRDVNPAFEATFDVSPDDVAGESLAAILPAVRSESGEGPDSGPSGDTTGERRADPDAFVDSRDEPASGTAFLPSLLGDQSATTIVRYQAVDEDGVADEDTADGATEGSGRDEGDETAAEDRAVVADRYFQVNAVRTGDCGGADEAFLVYTDVTDLERRASRWERSAHRLEQFASVAAHDIRNPLEVAEIRLEAARETDEDIHFEKVEESLDRIQQIVDDVLSVGAGSIDPSDAVPVGDCAEAAWDTVDTAEAALAVSPALPTVAADRSRLRQLFENLFRNAIEHGRRDVTVAVEPLPDGFAVIDDGPGIPPDQRERVFDTGYSSTRDNTGLGLAIVERIATAHGWNVAVTSAADGGARFEITGVDVTDDRANEAD